MTQRSFWWRRLASLTALVGTLVAWFTTATRVDMDAQLFAEYGISSGSVQIFYFIALIVMIPIFFLEPKLRAWLVVHRAAWALIPLVGMVSAGAVLLSGADQSARLFRYPLSLWVMIAYIIGLCLYTVWLVHDESVTGISKRLEQAIIGVLIVAGLLMVVAYTASVGEFMSLDLPDEPWLASMATNFALNDDLSPSYLASVYGSPDPVLGRYYLLMGWWLRLVGSTSLVSLRLFPLLVAGLAVILTGVALRHGAGFTWRQTLTGVVVLLGFSAFGRTSHNLRMDIGLAVYGALVLWGLLEFFHRNRRQKRWTILLGMALIIGLETVPIIGLIFGTVVGLTLVVWWLRQSGRRANSVYVVTYGAATILAGMSYFALHFLPDISANLQHYRDFSQLYASLTTLGELRDPFPTLLNYYAKFSMILSPVEIVIVVPALLLLSRRSPADRRLLMISGLTLLFLPILATSSYGYLVLFTPFLAYAVAATWSSRLMLMGGMAVLLPALVILPANDMVAATSRQKNAHIVAETSPLLEAIPPGSVVVGEPLFWFELHPERTFVGWTGVSRLNRLNGLSTEANLRALNVDVVICWTGYTDRCNAVAGYPMFDGTEDFVVNGETYWILWRANTPNDARSG